MQLRCVVVVLTVAAVVLPIVSFVVVAVGWLLQSLGDAAAATTCGYLAMAGGTIWVICLVALVIVEGILLTSRTGDDD